MSFWKTATTIGINILKVPQDVPVAKARKHATRKIIAGKKFTKSPATDFMELATKSLAPRESVIALSVHAIISIKIAGTIALNPSTRQSIHSLNGNTLLITYNNMVITNPKKLPNDKPTDALLLENASINPTPLKNPPVYIIPITQHTTRHIIGINRSLTLPFFSAP